jgi:hypothetical protein
MRSCCIYSKNWQWLIQNKHNPPIWAFCSSIYTVTIMNRQNYQIQITQQDGVAWINKNKNFLIIRYTYLCIEVADLKNNSKLGNVCVVWQLWHICCVFCFCIFTLWMLSNECKTHSVMQMCIFALTHTHTHTHTVCVFLISWLQISHSH